MDFLSKKEKSYIRNKFFDSNNTCIICKKTYQTNNTEKLSQHLTTEHKKFIKEFIGLQDLSPVLTKYFPVVPKKYSFKSDYLNFNIIKSMNDFTFNVSYYEFNEDNKSKMYETSNSYNIAEFIK